MHSYSAIRNWLTRHADLFASAVLISITAVYGAVFVGFRTPPFEDAAMLMRYSENLAHGEGIVWNRGEAPVDGATDFLFMTGVAGLIEAGLSTGRSVRVLSLTAHVLTLLLVYAGNRKLWGAGVLSSLVAGMYFAVGPGLWYASAYFGTPLFALCASLVWALGLALMRANEPPDRLILVFGLSCLLAGLARPEGALLAFLVLAGVTLYRGVQQSRRIILLTAVIMLAGGGSYFVWHWSYFGHALPNPFYKKGGGLLHWDSLWESLIYSVRIAGPFVVAFALGLRGRECSRLTLATTVPILGFAALFILISNETNFAGRFQYALLPLVLLCCHPLLDGVLGDLQIKLPSLTPARAKLAWGLAAFMLLFGYLVYAGSLACQLTGQAQSCSTAYERDGRYDVARLLAEYRDRGYVIATSEAGLLPLYSGWRAVDTWGLNDSWIAQHGEITPEYLDKYHPELIVFHAYFSPLEPPGESARDTANDWHRMTLVLKEYAESREYDLVAAFGEDANESHYYYVRRNFPDAERITRDILNLRAYRWYGSGRKSVNFAMYRG